MKAPAFWYRSRGMAAQLLSPLGCLCRGGGMIRRAIATPYHAQVPVICVGNIVAGGSGKTPVTLALADILKQQGHKPVFVTRGYGGRERGPMRVDSARHRAADVGDEALLLVRAAPVWIGRDRVAAIREAEKEATHILLDDGLQNPHVQPDLSLLVIDFDTGLGNGCFIPAGPLREPLGEALRRVHAVVALGNSSGREIFELAENPRVKTLAARLQPDLPAGFPCGQKFFAFAGIGRPEKFYRTCREASLALAGTRDFADHHIFSAREFDGLKFEAAKHDAQLLTTEKDCMRLPLEFRASVAVLPVKLIFDQPVMVNELLASACQKPATPAKV